MAAKRWICWRSRCLELILEWLLFAMKGPALSMLTAQGLSLSFGNRRILSNVGLQLAAGQVHALVGPNGAGKTTLFNVITGFLRADSGRIFLRNKRIDNLPPHAISRLGVARSFQDLRMFDSLSVREHILTAFKLNRGEHIWNAARSSSFFGADDKLHANRTEEILENIGLLEAELQLAAELSYGQQKMLSLGCCMAGDPEVVLLDEPTAGINPEFIPQIRRLIAEFRDTGATVLFIDHNPEFVNAICDHVHFLAGGGLRSFPTYDAMKEDESVQEAYL